ncbi:hypothetical protein [Pseudoalteromonas sp. MMG007]|uniref:hypothetical protein n=1 Tax=Pseudoalteromonas sp. MMG007 TaxID=2822684 RepID=UPI001B3843D0|nr:hypothetical protein [Pseudoalteromonas sp. MMG007]MBQ4859992.1 hypothetical protein [Pseudoalteromonas sp. MMG007]
MEIKKHSHTNQNINVENMEIEKLEARLEMQTVLLLEAGTAPPTVAPQCFDGKVGGACEPRDYQ